MGFKRYGEGDDFETRNKQHRSYPTYYIIPGIEIGIELPNLWSPILNLGWMMGRHNNRQSNLESRAIIFARELNFNLHPWQMAEI